MKKSKITLLLPSLLLFTGVTLSGQDEGNVSPLVDAPDEKADQSAAEAEASPSVPTVGSKAYDAASMNELYEELKAENERRAAEMAPHLNADSMEVIELRARDVKAYEVNNLDLLLEKLDPQPRRRLQRLAELDPAAAADLQVSIRSEERFFAGESDYTTDMNAGQAANVDFREVGKSFSEAFEKAKAAVRKKKVTDDQAALPTESE